MIASILGDRDVPNLGTKLEQAKMLHIDGKDSAKGHMAMLKADSARIAPSSNYRPIPV